MKKRIFSIAFAMLVLITAFIACKKSLVEDENRVDKAEVMSAVITPSVQTLVFQFKWSGGNTDRARCAGGICGICPGICIKFGGKKKYELTPADIASGTNYANVSITTNNKIKIIPFASMDNGNGTVTIDEDYIFDQDITQTFGKNLVKIHAGTYNINYNSNSQFGEVEINATIN